MTARTCPICGCLVWRPSGAKYCSRVCANEARRAWHASHPGANRPTRQAPTSLPAVKSPLAGYREPPPALPEPPRAATQPATQVCRKTACGREFVPRDPRQLYCSLECQRTRNAGKTARTRAPAIELRPWAPRPSNSPARTATLKSAQVQKARRERERERDEQQQVAEERRQEVIRPHFRLIFDPRVVIGPGRPAPVKRYTNGVPCEFQDDLDAMADHGSPRHAMPSPEIGHARMSALAGVG
jgi:hypothetical protein